MRNKGKSLVTFPASFAALDIETTGLDATVDSIIELSAVKVKDGKVTDTFSTLVNPEQPIDWWITELTGITDDMVKDAPTIDKTLGDFVTFLGDDVVVGHNVNFDINFIYDNHKRITDNDFSNDFIDTLRLARFLLKDLSHHRLGDLVEYLGIGSEVKHRGLDDAKATLDILLTLKDKATEAYGDVGNFEKAFADSLKGLDAKDISSTKSDFDITHPLYGKSCVFTGTLAKMPRKQAFQTVVDFGGQVENSITKKTNYLIIGSLEYAQNIKGGKSSKLKKAERMIVDGKDIQILSENVFYDMVVI
jgi:DNA polymerase-3 subunit epsilon